MKNVQQGVRLIAWLVALFATVLAAGQTRLGVPSYQDPGSPQWTAWAAAGAKAVGVMIVNLNNGDDETYYPSVQGTQLDFNTRPLPCRGSTFVQSCWTRLTRMSNRVGREPMEALVNAPAAAEVEEAMWCVSAVKQTGRRN